MNAPHNTPPIPSLELKEMDGAMLAFELTREIGRIFEADKYAREFVISSAMVATHLHRHQTRLVRKKFPRVPYIEHPIRVTLRMIGWGERGFHLLAAGMLHDTFEDCAKEIVLLYAVDLKGGIRPLDDDRATARRWVAQACSSETAALVHQVTNPPAPVTYDEHLQELAAGGAANRDALVLKAADLVDNPGSLAHQHGHVPDSFIAAKVYKYYPNVVLVADALRAIAAVSSERDEAVEAAVVALDDVAANLKKLATYLNIELEV